jgi:hypothetical protein
MTSRPANVGPGAGVGTGILERHDPAGTTEHRDGRRQQPVVGPDEQPALHLDRDATPIGADPRVDDRQHHAVGEVLDRAHERERAGPHVERRDVVGHVDDAQVRDHVEHHRMADTDELVGPAVVGQERHERRTHRPTVPGGANRPDRQPLVPRRQIGVHVGVPDPERPADANRRQVARLDQAVDRHRRHPQQLRHFLNRQEACFRKGLRHATTPLPRS